MLPYKKYFANYSVRKPNYLNGTKHEKYPFKAIINQKVWHRNETAIYQNTDYRNICFSTGFLISKF